MDEQQKIFIKLLDEGSIDVFRPTQALVLGDGKYKLLGFDEYDPETETWQFIPGTVVKGVFLKDHKGGDFLAAVEEVKI